VDNLSTSNPYQESPSLESKASPEVQHLLDTINDDPNWHHSEYTPSVNRLIVIGTPAIPAVLRLFETGDLTTRRRTAKVLEEITMAMYGFRIGQGWDSEDGEDQWWHFWKSLGNLDADDSERKRRRSVRLWRKWLAEEYPVQ
jgi:hypothetical protein